MSERDVPPRPAIPPSFWVLAACFGGNALSRWAHGLLGGDGSVPEAWVVLGALLPTLLAIVLATVFVSRLVPLFSHAEPEEQPIRSDGAGGKGIPGSFSLLIIVVLGACASFASTMSMFAAEERACAILESSPMSTYRFEAVSVPSCAFGVYRVRARVRSPNGWVGEVMLRSKERISFGESVSGVGSFAPNGTDGWGSASASQGLAGSVKLVRVLDRESPAGPFLLLTSVRDSFLDAIDPDAGDSRALLAGMVCAERSALSASGLLDSFSRVGSAHMLAVSGAHLSILSWMLGSMLEDLRIRPAPRFSVILGVGSLFVLLCAEPVSAVRSWLMSCVGYAGTLGGRRSDGLASLCAVAIVMALSDPGCMGELGFLLSVFSVAGICLFSRYFEYVLDVLVDMRSISRLVPRTLRRRAYSMWDGLRSQMAMSAAALFTSLPVSIEAFGEAPMLSVFANALLAPLFNLILSLSIALLASHIVIGKAFPALFASLLALYDPIAGSFAWLVRGISSLPHVSAVVLWDPLVVWAIAIGAAAALLILWPAVSRKMLEACSCALAVCALISALSAWLLAPARIIVLDIGQGDAIVVQDGPACILVDTGPDDSLVRALARNGIPHVDAVVLTHMHDDHIGGLPSLVGHVSVGSVFVAEGVADNIPDATREAIEDLGSRLREISYGDSLVAGGFTLTMLWPIEKVDGDGNADSIMLRVAYASGRVRMEALLTGDAERDELAGVLARNAIRGIDVLKVGHHGSEASLTASQAKLLSPLISVASAGLDNPYGHPSGTCVDLLEGVGSAFLCTAEVGDVVIEPQRDGVAVRTTRPP